MARPNIWRLTGVEAGQVVLPDGVQPVRQAFALVLGEHDREGADMPGEGVEFGAMGADGLEPELLGLGEGLRGVRIRPAAFGGEGDRAVTGRSEVRFLRR